MSFWVYPWTVFLVFFSHVSPAASSENNTCTCCCNITACWWPWTICLALSLACLCNSVTLLAQWCLNRRSRRKERKGLEEVKLIPENLITSGGDVRGIGHVVATETGVHVTTIEPDYGDMTPISTEAASPQRMPAGTADDTNQLGGSTAPQSNTVKHSNIADKESDNQIPVYAEVKKKRVPRERGHKANDVIPVPIQPRRNDAIPPRTKPERDDVKPIRGTRTTERGHAAVTTADIGSSDNSTSSDSGEDGTLLINNPIYADCRDYT